MERVEICDYCTSLDRAESRLGAVVGVLTKMWVPAMHPSFLDCTQCPREHYLLQMPGQRHFRERGRSLNKEQHC